MIQLPKRYRAKSNDSDQWFEGYYFQYPETTYCFEEDYITHPPKIVHCLAFHTMTDWGLPNRVQYATIDPDTLEEIEQEEKKCHTS